MIPEFIKINICMKITSTGIVQEPLFPDYTFTTKIELGPAHIGHTVESESTSAKNITHWGWDRKEHGLTPHGKKVAKLTYNRYFEIITGNYGIETSSNSGAFIINHNGKLQELLPVTKSSYFMSIKAGHSAVIAASRSVHTAVCFIKCDLNSHSLKIRTGTPRSLDCFMPQDKIIGPEASKVFFYPSAHNLEIVPNSSDDDTLIMVMQLEFRGP